MWTHPYLKMEEEKTHLNEQQSHSWKALKFAFFFFGISWNGFLI